MKKNVLVVVDVQNDFTPGGSLAVPGGDTIIPGINKLMVEFKSRNDLVILTQDWHPDNHESFAVNQNREPYDIKEMPYGPQRLWPKHCVQGTIGAEFHPVLQTKWADLIIRKGTNTKVDSYSAFQENDKNTLTGLGHYLAAFEIFNIYFVGLALDFCVGYSAIDFKVLHGVERNTNIIVYENLTRAIDFDGSLEAMKAEFEHHDIQLREYEND